MVIINMLSGSRNYQMLLVHKLSHNKPAKIAGALNCKTWSFHLDVLLCGLLQSPL